MVEKRLQTSIMGMLAGAVIVTLFALMYGAPVYTALMVSLIGVAVGGMIAERLYDRKALKAEQKKKRAA